ncbi:hypothetical protein FHS23_004628 [Prauserella isguenensis]|uniref:Uncharacterized protein n=1 Tax=Prauserella isguenensis TaxID=1470180 RepID=A0A839S878_9PSEU|nr:hypothetical protein [Prauserella isguenensis]MBB3053574.1 hypothetical protein [Prauserella isguenensis]
MTTIASPDPIIGQPDGTEAIDAAGGSLPNLWHVHRMLHTVKDGRVELSTDGGSYLVDGRRATDVEVRFLDQLVDSGYVEGDFFGDVDGRTVQLTPDGDVLVGRWRGFKAYTSRGGGRCG